MPIELISHLFWMNHVQFSFKKGCYTGSRWDEWLVGGLRNVAAGAARLRGGPQIGFLCRRARRSRWRSARGIAMERPFALGR